MEVLMLNRLRIHSRWQTLIPLLMSVVCIFAGNAQEPKRFASKGTIELGGTISFQSITPVANDKTGDATNIFSAMPFAGYFVFDGFEVGVNPVGVTVVNSGGTTITQLRMFIAPSYNFKTQSIAYPFVEGLAGLTSQTSGGSTISGFSWGGRGGVKIALTEKGLLNIGAQYLVITANPKGVTKRNGTNELSVLAGWTVWF